MCRPVMLVPHGSGHSRPPDRLLEPLRRVCAGEPLLASVGLLATDDILVGVYADDSEAEPAAHAQAWERVVRRVGTKGLAVSVGRRARTGADLRESLHGAHAVARLQRRDTPYLDLPAIAITEELGPVADVLLTASNGHIAPFLQRVLGGLLTDRRFGGSLIETLHAYLVSGGSLREAGRMLHLHTSSVKYRIRVLRDLLGPRLDDPLQRLDLELAVRLLMAARDLGGSSGTGACAAPGA